LPSDAGTVALLSSGSEASIKGVTGSDLIKRVRLVIGELMVGELMVGELVAGKWVELCIRRTPDCVGGFGSGLRYDSERLGA